MINGKGYFRWEDGTHYEGNYEKNLKHGYGEYTYSNGKIYMGPWKEGKQHGNGIIINPDMSFTKYNFD